MVVNLEAECGVIASSIGLQCCTVFCLESSVLTIALPALVGEQLQMPPSEPTLVPGSWEMQAVVFDFGDGTFLVRWNNHTHVQDTREPLEHIFPKAKVTYFRKSLIVDGVDVAQILYI